MENTSDTISRLKFIGKVKKGEKVNIRSLCLQTDSVYTSISRTVLYPDCRSNTLSFIRGVVNNSFNIINECIEGLEHSNKNRRLMINLMRDLETAKQGLSNLKVTYSEDTMFCCNLDTIIEFIDSNISEIKYKYSQLFVQIT